ncbi:hypothetical protein P8C59_007129 [Phyllachora maydis]|uniref:GAG-pre-integrase domain-containing protein n=1 Tax=Phyllachora maydis TaxID=1825666 RepID=A0AAD9MF79_9PEZI|nr:hypothetical protein P8C59_007129 [Phyllachora maydis]
MDLDSPPRPPRKEPHLGPAIDNTATSNLDPPIDIGSKEGFKDTITSSIVKELSKKAYTIPDDKSKKEDVYNEFHALTFSTYKKGLSAFNAEFNGYLAKLTITEIDIDPSIILNYLNIEYLIADILEESRNPAIEAYRAAYIAHSSNSTPNSNFNPSKKCKNKKKGSYNLAIEEEEEFDSSSNSRYKKRKDFKGKGLKTSSNNKAKYKDNQPRRRPRDPALYNSWLYDTGSTDHISNSKERPAGIGSIILEVLSRKAPPIYTKLVLDNVLYLPNIDINIRNKIVVEIPSNSIRKEDYRPIIEDSIVSEAIEPNKRYKLRNSPAKGTTLEGIGPSLRGKRPCRPIEPLATTQAPYQSPCKTREPEPLTGTGDLPCMLREPVIEGNKVVEKAISSPTLKEPNIGQRDYYNLLNLAKLWHVRLGHIGLCLLKKTSSITKGLPNFDKIKEADFHCSSCDRGKAVRRVSKALIPDPPRVLDLIEGDTVKIRPRPYNRNPIVLLPVDRKMELVNSTAITNKETTPFQALFDELEPGILHIPNLERYRAIRAKGEAIIPLEKRSKSLKFTSRTEECKLLAPTDNTALEGELVDLDLDLEGAVSLDPSNLNTEKPINIEIEPNKLESYESSSDKPIFIPKPIVVIAPNQPTRNEPLDNSDLISERDKMQLDYYKLLAKTSSYILSFVYKARKRVISKDSTPTTYKQVLKLPRDEHSKWLEAITKEFIQLLELGVFKFLLRSLLPSNYKLITCRNVLKVKKDAKNRPIKYKSREEIYIEIPKGLLDLAASNKAIYKLLLKYSYNPSTPNIIKLSKALYRVFYNTKTCHFIVTYVDDCLFIGPNIGYITDLKKRLNKVYTIEDLGPAAYFLGYDIGIPAAPLAPAPILAKPAKIMPAVRRVAACEAKRRELAKARATAGRAAAAKRSKKEDLQRSKHTTGGNAGRYTTDSGLIANKDDNNTYNGVYVPPANIEKEEEKEEGSSSDNNGVNSSTSDSADKGEGSDIYKRSKGALRCEDILLYK